MNLPDQCPYNIQRVTPFQSPYGDVGYEAIIREWGRKIGSLVAPPLPLTLLGFNGADAVQFRLTSESVGQTPECFAESLVLHFKDLKTERLAAKTRANFELEELRRLEKEAQKRGTLYRLTGFKPKKWDWLGTDDVDIARTLLERTYPGQVLEVINLESLKSPTFQLPY